MSRWSVPFIQGLMRGNDSAAELLQRDEDSEDAKEKHNPAEYRGSFMPSSVGNPGMKANTGVFLGAIGGALLTICIYLILLL